MTDLFSLSGKTALVTGASQGLGRRFARVLADNGAEVILAARQTNKLESLAAEIAEAGGQATTVALDVTDQASIDSVFASSTRIDVVVNNAGVAVSKSVLDHTEADWDQVVDTNLKGAFFVAQAAAKRMVEQGGGAIVNIGSVLSLEVVGHLSSYAASKGGVWQLTKAMALELARHHVRVNTLAPGYILTDINREHLESDAGQRMLKRIPQRRYGTPEDLDGALLFLASDASRYMTGSILVVDGGFRLT